MFSPNTMKILDKRRNIISTYDVDENMNLNNIESESTISNDDKNTDDELNQLLVDVLETDKSLTIICPMPGISLSDISITLDEDTLSISGECIPPVIDGVENKNYLIKEVNWGIHRRDIILPHNVQKANIKARFVNGILIVDIPKQPKIKGKSIKIESVK